MYGVNSIFICLFILAAVSLWVFCLSNYCFAILLQCFVSFIRFAIVIDWYIFDVREVVQADIVFFV